MSEENVAVNTEVKEDVAVDTSNTSNEPGVSDNAQPDAQAEVQSKEAPATNDKQEGVTKEEVISKWPNDWRSLIAGDDEKMQKYLDRFNSPADIAKSGIDFRDKIAKGEYKRATEPPTDDEVAMKEWRSENGIPESADKYTLPEGVLFGEEDQAIVNEFLKDMHSNNVPDAFVQPALKWYADLQQKTLERESELDKQMKVNTEEALRSEWGAEYRANYNEVENFVKSRFSEEVAEALMASPDTVTAMAAISREINPAVTLFPNSQNPSQSIENEISSIESKMGTPEYAKDVKMQERYRQLVEAQQKIK